MSQNIYDQADFFAAYSRLPRSEKGLDAAPEWPVLRGWLGDLSGARVLDLGCGFGWFCRWARGVGASEVLGLDLSRNMLAAARAAGADAAIRYETADLETAPIAPGAWDLIYSSLALHYVAGIDPLFARIAAGLRPGGRFTFTVEHPLYTAPSAPGFREIDGCRVWPLDRYLDAGPRTTDWLAPGVVKQHRPIGAYLAALLAAGLRLEHFEEWAPSLSQIRDNPTWTQGRDCPYFLLVSARSG